MRGQVLKLHSHNRFVFKLYVDDVHLDEEVARLEAAIRMSGDQLQSLKSQLAQKVGHEHSFILEAHLLMLEDHTLISEIISTIRGTHANAEWAVLQATERLRKAVASLHNEYLRERASDIENVAERILANLSGSEPIQWSKLPRDLILISHDFSPSSFGAMDLERVRGLALESGGRTSHTAIISRSLRIPAVMGIPDLLSHVTTGDPVILDGDDGQLIVNPSQERIESIGIRMAEFEEQGKRDFSIPRGSSNAHDDTHVSLRANTDLPHEVIAAKRCGAEGIGLFRTDFYLFALPACPPDVESQIATYSMLAREMNPYPVAVRTRDTGMEIRKDRPITLNRDNASMGLRGIRLSLIEKDHFCAQVEAILRAGESGNMEIVLPMVTSLEEVRWAKTMIEDVRNRVFKNADTVRRTPIGAMIEVPAAVMALEALAREVDFLCVGTNDLIQYMLAVDRGNPQVSHLFQPLHPAVLYALKRIAVVSKALGIPARVCGEMSANPFFAVLLLGLGFTEFSMNAFSIPAIRNVIQELSPETGREIAEHALGLGEAREIGEYLLESVSRALHMELSSYAREVLSAAHSWSHISQ
jgi:phosphotransferase system enzyme I (PtsI)